MSKNSVYFSLSDVDGKREAKELKKGIGSMRGVLSVSVNSQKNNIAVDYDSSGVNPEQIEEKINELGWKISSSKEQDHIM
ncbi:MAG TPA: heavy-metal-associated domain-containing protein [Oscillospiraceae bacterium]|jgi:copper chaperone CopZ|nr:Heavy-metal-associated domain [Oscillospiraceae bacterium]MDN5378519.1 copper chaperone [Clostridiales bacterium]HOV41724.1 heavy-metal-associated domain-containing protein [Oscillospiraceae bacterium]